VDERNQLNDVDCVCSESFPGGTSHVGDEKSRTKPDITGLSLALSKEDNCQQKSEKCTLEKLEYWRGNV
jgi:hypothetical protein